MSAEDFIGAGSDGTSMLRGPSVLHDWTSTTLGEVSRDGLAIDDGSWDDAGVGE